jgi:hypothetical protein
LHAGTIPTHVWGAYVVSETEQDSETLGWFYYQKLWGGFAITPPGFDHREACPRSLAVEIVPVGDGLGVLTECSGHAVNREVLFDSRRAAHRCNDTQRDVERVFRFQSGKWRATTFGRGSKRLGETFASAYSNQNPIDALAIVVGSAALSKRLDGNDEKGLAN